MLALIVKKPWLTAAETNDVFAGKVSLTDTLSALFGPLLVTVTMYVTVLPARTGSGLSVIRIERSAAGTTTVDSESVLLARSVSGAFSVAVTVARSLTTPIAATVGRTLIVTVADCPAGIVPS